MSLTLAQKYINDHNNPVSKQETFGSKLFVADASEEQKQSQEKCLRHLEATLCQDRVDRKMARSFGEWTPQENVIRVIKLTGSAIAQYGYQNKKGKFLDLNECLFLLETNKLELMRDTISVSIQEIFKIGMKNFNVQFRQYLAFKKLNLQGYKLRSVPAKTLQIPEREYEPPTKSSKTSYDDNLDILKALKRAGPQADESTSYLPISYFINHPETAGKVKKTSTLIIDTNDGFISNSVTNEPHTVYAWYTDGTAAFYQFSTNCIPMLE